MSIASRVITAFTKTLSALAAKPPLTAPQMQAWFDQSPEECRLAINGLIADLVAQTAAAQLGFAPTADIASSTIQTAVEEVLVTAKDAQRGTILPGTLTTTELAQALARAAIGARIHNVGGTATAITVTDADITALYDNMPLNIMVGASNSSAATTLAIGALGASPVYKVGTTDAPNLTAGKQASFWYDAGAVCFFLKASADGTAIPAQVLAGVPFSSEAATGQVGEMPARTGDSAATDLQLSGSTLRLRPPEGHYNGVSDYVINADGDRIAANVMAGATFDGLTGTIVEKIGSGTVITPSTADQAIPAGRYGGAAGDGKVLAVANASAGNIKSGVVIAGETGTYVRPVMAPGALNVLEKTNTVSSNSESMAKVREFTVNNAGSMRIAFSLQSGANWAPDTVYAHGQIYKNGTPVGTERLTILADSYTTYTEDIAGWVVGDLLQLYMLTPNPASPTANNSFTVSLTYAPVS